MPDQALDLGEIAAVQRVEKLSRALLHEFLIGGAGAGGRHAGEFVCYAWR